MVCNSVKISVAATGYRNVWGLAGGESRGLSRADYVKGMVGARGFEPRTSCAQGSSRKYILLVRLALFCVLNPGFGPYSAPIGPKLDPSSPFLAGRLPNGCWVFGATRPALAPMATAEADTGCDFRHSAPKGLKTAASHESMRANAAPSEGAPKHFPFVRAKKLFRGLDFSNSYRWRSSNFLIHGRKDAP